MSEQLVGVIVGALIGFTGTLLSVLIHSRIEKDKRREERLWRFRKDRMESKIEPAWQSILTLQYEMVDWLDHVLKIFDRLQEVPDKTQETDPSTQAMFDHFTERCRDIQRTMDRLQKHEFRTIRTYCDVKVGQAISEVFSDFNDVVQDIGSKVQDLNNKYIHDEEVGSDELNALIQDLSTAEVRVTLSVRKVEGIIEEHLTKL